MSQLATLVSENVKVLRHAALVVGGLDEGRFGDPPAAVAGSSVGPHVRHCLDFYDSFLVGLPAGRVDYNLRLRDLATERSPDVARTRLACVADALERIGASCFGSALRVRADGAGDVDDPTSWSRSSVARELQFLLSHTIHHFALVAILLRAHGVEPGEEFGVAPSTLEHRRRAGATVQKAVPARAETRAVDEERALGQ